MTRNPSIKISACRAASRGGERGNLHAQIINPRSQRPSLLHARVTAVGCQTLPAMPRRVNSSAAARTVMYMVSTMAGRYVSAVASRLAAAMRALAPESHRCEQRQAARPRGSGFQKAPATASAAGGPAVGQTVGDRRRRSGAGSGCGAVPGAATSPGWRRQALHKCDRPSVRPLRGRGNGNHGRRQGNRTTAVASARASAAGSPGCR